ncbi:MAG: AraC family transcriptional regulator [Flavobacteriaceae bacterium]
MKPKLVNRGAFQNESFNTSYLNGPSFFKVWHYHPELELIVILESEGTQFVGDSIEKFQSGDVLLLGKNVPHLLLNDSIYFEKQSNLKARAISINFNQYFLGNTFLSLPEMKHIRKLLERSKQGIKFQGTSKLKAVDIIKKIASSSNFDRIIELIKLLGILAKTTEYRLLTSIEYSDSLNDIETSRIGKVYDYVMNNFDKNLSLQRAAKIVHMNPKSFSRFFKKNAKKNFTKYINEVRIGYACKLLLEKKMNISEICYEIGFNNISYFNRQFKSIEGLSPKEYVKLYDN